MLKQTCNYIRLQSPPLQGKRSLDNEPYSGAQRDPNTGSIGLNNSGINEEDIMK